MLPRGGVVCEEKLGQELEESLGGLVDNPLLLLLLILDGLLTGHLLALLLLLGPLPVLLLLPLGPELPLPEPSPRGALATGFILIGGEADGGQLDPALALDCHLWRDIGGALVELRHLQVGEGLQPELGGEVHTQGADLGGRGEEDGEVVCGELEEAQQVREVLRRLEVGVGKGGVRHEVVHQGQELRVRGRGGRPSCNHQVESLV